MRRPSVWDHFFTSEDPLWREDLWMFSKGTRFSLEEGDPEYSHWNEGLWKQNLWEELPLPGARIWLFIGEIMLEIKVLDLINKSVKEAQTLFDLPVWETSLEIPNSILCTKSYKHNEFFSEILVFVITPHYFICCTFFSHFPINSDSLCFLVFCWHKKSSCKYFGICWRYFCHAFFKQLGVPVEIRVLAVLGATRPGFKFGLWNLLTV